MSNQNDIPVLTKKDFVSDQDIKWCPGCGDYAILAQVQKVFPSLGAVLHNTVFQLQENVRGFFTRSGINRASKSFALFFKN